MATKTFYATRDLKNPGYGTRMLKAGDPVELTGPQARLYRALGAVSPTKPKRGPQPGDTVTLQRADGAVFKGTVEAEGTATLKATPKPRKRTAKKK